MKTLRKALPFVKITLQIELKSYCMKKYISLFKYKNLYKRNYIN